MAALEMLEARRERIRVTRIVGASAGAIAGALFASGVGIHNTADDWRNGGLQTLLESLAVKRRCYLPKALSLLLHLVKKKPLWDEKQDAGLCRPHDQGQVRAGAGDEFARSAQASRDRSPCRPYQSA